MDAKAAAIKRLRKEGYTRVFSWKDRPNKVYRTHFHLKESKIIVVDGSIRINIEGKAGRYSKGDKIWFAKRARHSAVVGRKGGTFVEGWR
ncbi:MAG: hypothetical protein KGH72_06105 [Candidatus Micrarchaeota archaeon]|nr:hypothetical protein [Candidatus Micrarchaeota archaeon]